MKRLLMVMLVMGWTSPVWAAFYSGNDLFADCQVAETEATYWQLIGRCSGYILGAHDAGDGPDGGIGGFTFCSPPNANVGQVTDIVVKWLDDNPQHRHYDASSLVVAALSEVWPCP